MLVYSETLGKCRKVKERVIFTLFRFQRRLERRLMGWNLLQLQREVEVQCCDVL